MNQSTVAGFLAVILTFALGCGGADERPPLKSVEGQVVFNNQPVTEGTVTFEDAQTGSAATAELDAEGRYELNVPDGTYQVTIAPPMVEVSSDPNSPPEQKFKDVANIPNKYRSAQSTDLSATVSEEKTSHDFNLAP